MRHIPPSMYIIGVILQVDTTWLLNCADGEYNRVTGEMCLFKKHPLGSSFQSCEETSVSVSSTENFRTLLLELMWVKSSNQNHNECSLIIIRNATQTTYDSYNV